jgi:hypothetical protein
MLNHFSGPEVRQNIMVVGMCDRLFTLESRKQRERKETQVGTCPVTYFFLSNTS